EDLETLWKLVKDKHGNTRPEEDYERVLWGDIKVMFEPDIESEVWRQLQGYDVTTWKLFSSSGVHFVRLKNLNIFMLVDKIYPLTPATITKMLERKLQADQWNEMPTGGRGIGYGVVSTLDAKARRRGIREVGYGIRDIWVDPTETVLEIAPMTVGEDRLKLKELMELYTKVSDRVLNLETTKTAQANEIRSLKKRVKRLEKEKSLRTHRLKHCTRHIWCNDQDDTLMFDSNKDLQGEEVVVEDVNAASIATSVTTTTIERLVEEKAQKELEANNVVIEQRHDVKARIKADYQLAQRLRAKEQEQLTDAEKARLFMEFLEKRRKFFAAKRAEEKRNKPQTKAQ
nr:hypothetical protein [Tanacetum cinerariifolium]